MFETLLSGFGSLFLGYRVKRKHFDSFSKADLLKVHPDLGGRCSDYSDRGVVYEVLRVSPPTPTPQPSF